MRGVFRTGRRQGLADLRQEVFKPTAARYEDIPRTDPTGTAITMTSGTMKMCGIYLPAGVTISTITFVSNTTALGVPTHAWAALYSSALGKLAQSTDDTGITWAADAIHDFPLSPAYVTTAAGLYYVGLTINAGTMPTLVGKQVTATLTGLAPKLTGSSDTGLNTGTAPPTAAAISAAGTYPYCYVS